MAAFRFRALQAQMHLERAAEPDHSSNSSLNGWNVGK
jgi:hypothetical protein